MIRLSDASRNNFLGLGDEMDDDDDDDQPFSEVDSLHYQPCH